MAAKRKKNLIQFLVLIVAVVAVVAGSIGFQNWWNNRPGPEPGTVTIKANGQDIAPYMVCEPGVACPEGEVTKLAVGPDDTLKIELPREVYDHDWSLLKIYDDPAANAQDYFKGNEKKEVEVKGSADGEPRPRLVVVEVSTVLIGHDAQGVETPYTVVWSMGVS